jgi:hypothetical protein
MGAVTWTAYGTADDLSSGFSVLADAAGFLTIEVDNSSDLKMFGDLEVTSNSAITASGLDARVDVYLIPTYDGTNYPVPGSTAATMTGGQYVGSISSVDTVGTVAVTNYTNGTLRKIELPPTKFKIGIVNELGATFPAAANTIKLRRYGSTVA